MKSNASCPVIDTPSSSTAPRPVLPMRSVVAADVVPTRCGAEVVPGVERAERADATGTVELGLHEGRTEAALGHRQRGVVGPGMARREDDVDLARTTGRHGDAEMARAADDGEVGVRTGDRGRHELARSRVEDADVIGRRRQPHGHRADVDRGHRHLRRAPCQRDVLARRIGDGGVERARRRRLEHHDPAVGRRTWRALGEGPRRGAVAEHRHHREGAGVDRGGDDVAAGGVGGRCALLVEQVGRARGEQHR